MIATKIIMTKKKNGVMMMKVKKKVIKIKLAKVEKVKKVKIVV
jgi:hypothetical protein